MREGEEENSSKAWCEKSEEYAKGWRGSLLPQGTIEFSELPTEDMEKGHLYNISNAFVTDERFEEGAGFPIPQAQTYIGTKMSIGTVYRAR